MQLRLTCIYACLYDRYSTAHEAERATRLPCLPLNTHHAVSLHALTPELATTFAFDIDYTAPSHSIRSSNTRENGTESDFLLLSTSGGLRQRTVVTALDAETRAKNQEKYPLAATTEGRSSEGVGQAVAGTYRCV